MEKLTCLEYKAVNLCPCPPSRHPIGMNMSLKRNVKHVHKLIKCVSLQVLFTSVSWLLFSRGSHGIVPVRLGLTGVFVGWPAHGIQISLDAYSPRHLQHLVGKWYP